MSDDEFFTRLLYFGISQLHLSMEEFWLMPFGLLLDLRECDAQRNGFSKPKTETTIDDIIPDGI